MAEDIPQNAVPDEEIHPEVDWHLQALVGLANNEGMEMGVTLMLSGTVVTGTLISGKTYFEEFGALFADGFSDMNEEQKATIRQAMSVPADLYTPDRASVPISFIHLRNAKVRTPSGSMPADGTLWRGRLTEVSGFFLGSLS
ncbi:gas vesicle accessory protein GvpU [Cupriavidus alkaliphilus]|uniref:Gas vesicle protein n=1 Tax=Cupriavidus alkaliphilus TaxID=942866 RepID=A0A7W4YUK2_9BURK|nr:gas vesicle accessory protein GvpU [Cupriavidus alkaliphilus]MBB3010617.1 hypothetical protein [Cupriavidus alkaliphilus]